MLLRRTTPFKAQKNQGAIIYPAQITREGSFELVGEGGLASEADENVERERSTL